MSNLDFNQFLFTIYTKQKMNAFTALKFKKIQSNTKKEEKGKYGTE